MSIDHYIIISVFLLAVCGMFAAVGFVVWDVMFPHAADEVELAMDEEESYADWWISALASQEWQRMERNDA